MKTKARCGDVRESLPAERFIFVAGQASPAITTMQGSWPQYVLATLVYELEGNISETNIVRQ